MKIGSSDISAAYIGSTAVNKVYIGSTEVWSSFTGLLDTYTGAAAAYSLRLLSTSYTGSAIKVRRASDNTEQDIGFSNNVLDTTSLASFCSGTNGFVTTWYDQSGNGRNATQTTAAEQPKIYDSSTGVITENGKAAVQFDGLNDNLATTGSPFSATENTLIAVSKQSAVTSFYKRLICVGLFNSGRYLGTLQNQDDMLAIFNNSTFTCFGGTATSQNLSLMYNISKTGYLRQNGTQINTITNNNIDASYGSKNLYLGWDSARGTNESWNGIGQEFIFYPTQQSSSASGIENNINTYYGIY